MAEDDCRIVAYESRGWVASGISGAVKLEPSDEGACAPALADDPRPVLLSYISLRMQLCDVHTISGSRDAQIECARVLAQLAFDAGMFSLSTRLQHWAYTLASQRVAM